MKKKLLDNLGLKLLALFVAFLVWFTVMNGEDPKIPKSFVGISVTIRNEDSFVDAGKVYKVLDNTNIINIKVRAKRSVMAKLSEESFTVVADLKNVTYVDTVPLIVSCSNPNVKADDIECDPPSLKLSVEDSVEAEFIPHVVADGQLGSGYEVGTTKISEGDSLIISGPKDLINIIDKVMAVVDVEGITSSKSITTKLDLYDKNGTKLDQSQMNNLKFKRTDGKLITEAEVKVQITLWRVQKDIKLDIGTIGTPAYGYQITEITTTPSTISLAGTEEALEQLGGKLTIPDVISVEGATSMVKGTIDISDFLNDSFKKTLKQETNSADEISVKVQIEKIGTTTVSYPVSSLTITGKPEGLDMSLTPADKLSIEVQAESSDSKKITVDDIKASLNLKAYQKEGNYTVPIKVTLPLGYELVSDVTIAVNLRKSESLQDSVEEE